ncbi:MAG: hypothetical protein FJZ07_01840 [Candidatus Nealsonbacteria bacterium]|nr:hypothetical protein [Candidatus Nealsonbacteria bacterium]
MAITFIKEKKKQKYFILVFGAILLIILAILYIGFFREEKTVAPIEPLFIKKTITINFDILKSPALTELQPFEEIPLFEGEKGKENPFIPY